MKEGGKKFGKKIIRSLVILELIAGEPEKENCRIILQAVNGTKPKSTLTIDVHIAVRKCH